MASEDIGYNSDKEDGGTSGSEFEEENDMTWARKENPDLPNTVTVLESYEPLNVDDVNGISNVGKLYLIGTAHFSTESQDDVRKTIQETQPDLVMVELCSSRVAVLSMEEDKLLEEAKHLNFEKIMTSIRQSGFVQGVLYCMLLSMSAHITKQLGMAPGGEFRTAFKEAMQVPACRLHLGDRPIQVTLQRAFGALSLWQKLRLFAGILWSHGMKITKEDIEKAKRRDLLEEVLREMAGEFPELSKIFVQERDQYMAYVLRSLIKDLAEKRARKLIEDEQGTSSFKPIVAVGVVGMGHVPGIISNWTASIDVHKLLEIPPKSKWPKYVKLCVKGFVLGLVSYGVYRGCAGLYNYIKQ